MLKTGRFLVKLGRIRFSQRAVSGKKKQAKQAGSAFADAGEAAH